MKCTFRNLSNYHRWAVSQRVSTKGRHWYPNPMGSQSYSQIFGIDFSEFWIGINFWNGIGIDLWKFGIGIEFENFWDWDRLFKILGLGSILQNFWNGIGIEFWNFGIGVEFENFWDRGWYSIFLNTGLVLGLGDLSRPLLSTLLLSEWIPESLLFWVIFMHSFYRQKFPEFHQRQTQVVSFNFDSGFCYNYDWWLTNSI